MDFKPLIDLDSFESEQERYAYIEELKKESSLCSQSEQAIKLALNSIYGALANKWFHWINVDIAEAITLGGQHAIKATVEFVRDWACRLHTNIDLLLKFGKESIEPISRELEMTRYCDTDSVIGNSILNIENESPITIEEFFNREAKEIIISPNGTEFCFTNKKTLNYDHETKSLIYSPIKRIIKHKVSKAKYKITSSTGKEMIVTGDHSIIIIRNNNKMSIKACDLKDTDLLIELK